MSDAPTSPHSQPAAAPAVSPVSANGPHADGPRDVHELELRLQDATKRAQAQEAHVHQLSQLLHKEQQEKLDALDKLHHAQAEHKAHRDTPTANFAEINRFFNALPATPPVRKTLSAVLGADEFTKVVNAHFVEDTAINSIGNYLPACVRLEQMKHLTSHLEQDIYAMVRSLFKDGSHFDVRVAEDIARAREWALKTAVHKKRYEDAQEALEQGAEPLLRTRRPVFYVTEGSPVNAMLRQFSYLFDAEFRKIAMVNNNTDKTGFANFTMDPFSLERQVLEDLQDRTVFPCAVLATIGSPLGYQLDDIYALRSICDKYHLWLHAEGSMLFLGCGSGDLALTARLFQYSDSLCDEPLKWTNRRGFAGLLLLRLPVTQPTEDRPPAVDILEPSPAPELPIYFPPTAFLNSRHFEAAFRLWTYFCAHQPAFFTDYVDQSLSLCEQLLHRLVEHNFFRISGPPRDCFPHLLFFQVLPEFPLEPFNVDVNTYNRWIALRLRGQSGKLQISEYFYEGKYGFLFHPLSSPRKPSMQQLDEFIQSIIYETHLIALSKDLRPKFQELIGDFPTLKSVPTDAVNSFVGLGVFRFIPDVFSDSDQYVKELNMTNHALVRQLQQKEPFLYAPAVTKDEVVCIVIRAGPVLTADNCVRTLLTDIAHACNHLELPSEVTDRIAEVVRQGIQQAEKKLQDTHDKEFHPDTVLRKLPLLGNVWNWIVPSAHDANAGASASFDIRSKALSKPSFSPSPLKKAMSSRDPMQAVPQTPISTGNVSVPQVADEVKSVVPVSPSHAHAQTNGASPTTATDAPATPAAAPGTPAAAPVAAPTADPAAAAPSNVSPVTPSPTA